MRVLILGGTRFIGPRVVRSLSVAGHEVTVAHRGKHHVALPTGVTELLHEGLGAPLRAIPRSLTAHDVDVVLPMMLMGEADARLVVVAFAGRARRLVVPSSGDVYRAYGVFARLEEGPLVPTPLAEDSPLRRTRFPYRKATTPARSLEYVYDKILVEEEVRGKGELAATILRLPKVYGPDDNRDLRSVYAFRNSPSWRWTHGHVENVAKAITLAVLDERAINRTYNVGEAYTPTIAERLAVLPERPVLPSSREDQPEYRFEQNVEYDTTRIRSELQFVEDVDETTGMRQVLGASITE